MLSYFQNVREEIRRELKVFFDRKAEEFERVNALGQDLCARLYEFSAQGKMIRGGLVSLAYSLFRGDGEQSAVREKLVAAGAAMELFQSGLLVHDDIMDRDPVRRGLASLYHQYVEMADGKGIAESAHLGESLGICAGDVAFFLAFEILSGIDTDPVVHRDILSLCSRELSYVGIAQMQDVYNGASTEPVTSPDIMKLYLYKTGRYTFSLPLAIGGLLAGRSRETVRKLEEIGEHLGVIFQIRDDELGLFGDEQRMGKPVGSDVKEGKKTLYYGYLLNLAAPTVRRRLLDIFGREDLTEEDLAYVRSLTEELGVRKMIREHAGGLAEKARGLLESLHGVDEGRIALLRELLDYSMVRGS